MNKKILLLLTPIVFVFLLSLSAFAHPGRTDSQGGHRDSSTGTYHFHHGYPAHQHTNGVCPYDHDDKTDKSSSPIKSSNSQEEDNTYSTIPSTSNSSSDSKTFKDVLPILIIIFLCGGWMFLLIPIIAIRDYIILPIVEKIKDWHNK